MLRHVNWIGTWQFFKSKQLISVVVKKAQFPHKYLHIEWCGIGNNTSTVKWNQIA